MNGAHALIRTLVAYGVDVCFTNPGTSEMHFVAALDDVPEMRAVLALFEGVVTGAADGYGRMADKPAATLLHLGPGSATASRTCTTRAGRARRSSTSSATTRPITTQYDAPLTSDIDSAGAQRLGLDPRLDRPETSRARRGRRGRGGDGTARAASRR